VSDFKPAFRDAHPTVPAWLPEELRPLFLEVLGDLPAFPDRKTAARVVTARVHPLSPRTVEAWPLKTRRLNGKACLTSKEFVEYLFRLLLEAPTIRGGRRRTNSSPDIC
jgi:hypothetical protein